jgi:putative DNA primase/helicase
MTAPLAEAVSGMLAKRRVHWLQAYFPAGRIEGGMFLIGDPDGAKGRSLPIPLQPRSGSSLRDFGSDWVGDDLALMARAIGAGDDMKAAYQEALGYLGLGERDP